MSRNVIIDVDTGVDDSLAIVYAVRSGQLNIRAICTGFGNVAVEQATANTLALLELLHADIPVYAGAAGPLIGEYDGPVTHVHGEKGIGAATLPPPSRKASARSAMDAYIERSHLYPGDLTVVAVGRLTNLAHAIQKDPTLVGRIANVVVMGGAVTVPGNRTPVAEANIMGDPEAAEFVLQSGVPVTLIGLDVTMACHLHTRWSETWKHSSQPHQQFLGHALSFYMNAYQATGYSDGCPLHDPLAVMVAEDPSLVELVSTDVHVETQGIFTRGMTVADLRTSSRQSGGNVRVALGVDHERVVQRLIEVIGE